MHNFERELLGQIPLHEASSFFVGMKRFPVSDEQIKVAAARMKSAAQQQLDKLLAGDMPEGKAGRFKTLSSVKEAQVSPEHRERMIQVVAQSHGVDPDKLRGRMKAAAAKLGFGMASPSAGMADPDANMQGGQPTPAMSNLPALPGAPASMAPPEGPTQDPEAAKPSTQPTMPVNYMGAELLAQSAQQANEVGFLRQRLNAATEQNNMLNQHIQQIQSQLDEVTATQQSAGDQIMQASNEAVAASTRALEHSMQAANMRIGIQKMREAMMELASQDPESMGTLAQQQQVQQEQVMQQQVNAGAGTPGQSPTPQTQSGAPAAGAPDEGSAGPEDGGSGDSGSSSGSSKAPQVQIKTGGLPGGVLPGVLGGVGLAAMQGLRSAEGPEKAQAKVDVLEGQQGGGFLKAVQLAKAKHHLAETELQAKHPVGTTMRNAVSGGIAGGVTGAALHHLAGTLKHM